MANNNFYITHIEFTNNNFYAEHIESVLLIPPYTHIESIYYIFTQHSYIHRIYDIKFQNYGKEKLLLKKDKILCACNSKSNFDFLKFYVRAAIKK